MYVPDQIQQMYFIRGHKSPRSFWSDEDVEADLNTTRIIITLRVFGHWSGTSGKSTTLSGSSSRGCSNSSTSLAAPSPHPSRASPKYRQSFEEQLTEPRRCDDVDEEVPGVVESGQDVRGVQEDPTNRGLLDDPEQEIQHHPRSLADEEEKGNDEKGSSQPLVVRPPLIRRQVGLRRRRGRDAVLVDEINEDHVEYEDDDDDGISDYELDSRG